MEYLGQASQDERGSYQGGAAGDQTGREVAIRNYYNYPWNVYLEPIDNNLGDNIANNMITACNNNNIGYSQSTRNTCKDVNSTYKCNTDCSALVSLCVTQAGCDILKGRNNAPTTRELKQVLLATGKFKIVGRPTKRGTILLKEGQHTAIYLGADINKHSGEVPTPTPTPQPIGIGGIEEMRCTYEIDNNGTVYYFDGYKVVSLNHPDQWKVLKDIFKASTGRDLPHFKWSSKAPWYSRLQQVLARPTIK